MRWHRRHGPAPRPANDGLLDQVNMAMIGQRRWEEQRAAMDRQARAARLRVWAVTLLIWAAVWACVILMVIGVGVAWERWM